MYLNLVLLLKGKIKMFNTLKTYAQKALDGAGSIFVTITKVLSNLVKWTFFAMNNHLKMITSEKLRHFLSGLATFFIVGLSIWFLYFALSIIFQVLVVVLGVTLILAKVLLSLIAVVAFVALCYVMYRLVKPTEETKNDNTESVVDDNEDYQSTN